MSQFVPNPVFSAGANPRRLDPVTEVEIAEMQRLHSENVEIKKIAAHLKRSVPTIKRKLGLVVPAKPAIDVQVNGSDMEDDTTINPPVSVDPVAQVAQPVEIGPESLASLREIIRDEVNTALGDRRSIAHAAQVQTMRELGLVADQAGMAQAATSIADAYRKWIDAGRPEIEIPAVQYVEITP